MYHMEIISDMLKHKHVRIILLHVPYTEVQQAIVDSICMHSKKIIGQIERKPPIKDTAKEIQLLIKSHHEPFIAKEKLRYVIIGRQKPKI